MPTPGTVGVKFDTSITLQDLGSHWTAYVEPTGLTLRGSSREEVISKADAAVRFFIAAIGQRDGIAAVRRYLDYHEVQHSVVEPRPEASAARTYHIDRYGMEVEVGQVA